MLPSSQLRDVTIKDYFIILKRRIWVVLACFITISSWFTIKTFQKVSTYYSFARVQIQSTTPQLTPGITQVTPLPFYIDREYIQTQIGILTSRTMAKKAVELLIASGDNYFVGMPDSDKVFASGVSVNVQVGTQIINIGYYSTDPIKSAKYANALANTYLQEDVQRKVSVTKNATGWLEAELEALKKKLEKSEEVLNNFGKENSMVLSPDELEGKDETVISQLKKQKVALEGDIAELSKRYKEKHPQMIALKMKLDAMNENIEKQSNKLFNDSASTVKYNILKREVESNKVLYETVLRRIKETEVSKDLQTSNIRIIDYADVPRAPAGPNRKRDVSTGIMLGILVGLGLALLLEYLDSTIKNAEDVETYVKLPFLGYIPSAKQELKSDKDIDLACNKLPQSRIAEAFRSVRTSILFSTPEDRPLKTILVTSTSPQEGKTTVSTNLSIVFAYSKEKTLLIEADMRKPRITHSLNVDNNSGLSSYLAGTTSFEESVKPSFIPNLFIMPSGPKPPNPAELLTSTKSRSLLEEAKTKFDRIIVDTSPVLTVADASIIANMVDGVIQIIRASFQNIDLILRSRQRLLEVKSRIIGVILNNVDVKKEDSYYYYHYYYVSKDDNK